MHKTLFNHSSFSESTITICSLQCKAIFHFLLLQLMGMQVLVVISFLQGVSCLEVEYDY